MNQMRSYTLHIQIQYVTMSMQRISTDVGRMKNLFDTSNYPVECRALHQQPIEELADLRAKISPTKLVKMKKRRLKCYDKDNQEAPAIERL